MANAGIDPTRLYTVLNNTGLQNKDPQLYQLLYNLIGQLVKVTSQQNASIISGGGSSTTNIVQIIQQLILTYGGGSGSSLVIPGPPGPAGANGAIGAQGNPGPPIAGLGDSCIPFGLMIPPGSTLPVTDSGSSGNIFGAQFVDPTLTTFSWINQGTATVTTTGKLIYLLALAAAGDNAKIREITVPATPWTVTAAFVPFGPNLNFSSVGIGFRQSSDGKLATNAYTWDGNNAFRNITIDKLNSATSFNANYIRMPYTLAGPHLWMQITDDGTNRISRVSVDGINFTQIHSVGRTDFLTADRAFFFVNANNATWPSGLNLLSWALT